VVSISSGQNSSRGTRPKRGKNVVRRIPAPAFKEDLKTLDAYKSLSQDWTRVGIAKKQKTQSLGPKGTKYVGEGSLSQCRIMNNTGIANRGGEPESSATIQKSAQSTFHAGKGCKGDTSLLDESFVRGLAWGPRHQTVLHSERAHYQV